MIERERWIETEQKLADEPLYRLVEVYQGYDSLDWCVRRYKDHLMFLWANSGLFEGETPLAYCGHLRPWESNEHDWFHDFVCTHTPWEIKYFDIHTWEPRITEEVNWHKKYEEG